MYTTDRVDLTFEAPGPGAWELDATHRGRRPLTHFLRGSFVREVGTGTRILVERYGLPLAGIRMELVNGCLYIRPTGLGEGAKLKPPPPAPIMKLIARLHPEMRRRNRTAAQAWDEKRWRLEVDRWFGEERAATIKTNLEFQSVDAASLDDNALVEHVAALLGHFSTQARLNLENHGADLIPAGDFLAHCKAWGIDFGDATSLLRGSSPATIETAELLAPVARAIEASSQSPTSVEQIRALGSDANDAVDYWLEQHGWRLVTSDDIDKPTMAERPRLQLTALLAATAVRPAAREPPDSSILRAKIPADSQPLFDELLAEARYGMLQRDDVVGVRWNWSGGLLRRGLLEAGRRLTLNGRLETRDHAMELSPDELGPLLVDGAGPDSREVAARAKDRDVVEAARPPDTLGEPEPPPPIDAFPEAMARATVAMMTAFEAEALSGGSSSKDLTGTGIGSGSYCGQARVANSADDALDRLELGDVLVAPFTGPAYNSILPILGGLVVEAGGPMCHAAIMAREFGLPAVIGVSGAASRIPDGATVEVDAEAGVVRLIP
jgi:phosphohistidine swiveling domain-containing protein